MRQQNTISLFKHLLLLVVLAFSFISRSQIYPVQTNVSITGPYFNYLSYYADQNNHLQTIVTLTDFNAGPIQARLRIRIKGPGYELYTNPNLVVGLPFTLEPGVPQFLSGIDLAPYLLAQNLIISPSGLDINNLPEGLTTICIDVIKDGTGAEIISSNNCTSFFLQRYQPPQAFSPTCASNVNPQEMFHTFQWTYPIGYTPVIGSELNYTFSLYEWVDPNNYSIFETGQGLVFTAQTNSAVFQLSEYDVTLQEGMQYVWRVQAEITSFGMPVNMIENNGLSEICTFTFGASQTLEESLADGLIIDLNANANGERKGNSYWTVIDNTPGEGLSSYNSYLVSYRKKPTGNEGYELTWFSDTVSDFNHLIYQLAPNTTYEIEVAGIVGNFLSEPSNRVEFTTETVRAYACGEQDLPYLPAIYNPLPAAEAGMYFQIGQFNMQVTEITPIGALGHYSGKGLIPVAFLAGASAKVRFDDILVDDQYVIREGEVDVITKGLDNWLNEQYMQFIEPYYVSGTVDSAYVDTVAGVAWVVIDGQILDFAFNPPDYPVIVNDDSGNQYTMWPDGTIEVSFYFAISETWGVDSAQVVTFVENGTDTRGFDAKEYTEWHANYEIMLLNDSIPYFVANKSTASTEDATVDFILPSDNSLGNISFKIDESIAVSASGSTITLPTDLSKGRHSLEAYVGSQKIGQVNLFVYEQKDKQVIIVPIANVTPDANAIKTILDQTLGEANINVAVTVAPQWNDSLFTASKTIALPEDVGLLNKYSDDMRALRDAYFADNDTMPNDVYYIFVVPDFDDVAVDGYMVRGKSLGFVSASASVLTYAHELGHGIGALNHSWKDNGPGKGNTDNLMDYPSTGSATQDNLTKAQWKELRDFDLLPSMWDEVEDALAYTREQVVFAEFDALLISSSSIQPPQYSHFTPSGFAFSADISNVIYSYCTGAVDIFEYNNIRYTSAYRSSTSVDGSKVYNSFIGYMDNILKDSLVTVRFDNSLSNLQIANKQWEIIERNQNYFFNQYSISTTGDLYSEFNTLNCKKKKAIFQISNNLNDPIYPIDNYPLSGGLKFIGDLQLIENAMEIDGEGVKCGNCWTTSEVFASKDDYFSYDYSGIQGGKTKEYDTSPQSLFGLQLVDKFVDLIEANLRGARTHNYDGTSQLYHLIGAESIAVLTEVEKEVLEHRLAYLYDITQEKSPGQPIEFYVVFEETDIDGYYYLLNDFNGFAKEVYEKSSLKNKNAILITVPIGKYSSQENNNNGFSGVDYTDNITCYMPGLYSRSRIDYSKLKAEYKNSLTKIELGEFILDVYKQTYKPQKIFKAYQYLDGSIVTSIDEASIYVSGNAFCKEIFLYRKPEHDGYHSLELGSTGVEFTVSKKEGVVLTSHFSTESDYLKYEIALSNYIESANNSEFILYTPTGDIAKLKEKYIDENHFKAYIKYGFGSDFEQWVLNVYFILQPFTYFGTLSTPTTLETHKYYTANTWNVVSPIVYSVLDATGVALSFVGLDVITDGIGLAVSSVAGDYNQAAAYGTALVIVGVSAVGVKLVLKIGQNIAEGTKVFIKGANYIIKNGELTKITQSFKYGRVLRYFDIDDAITGSEMQTFIAKFNNGNITNAEIRSVLNGSTKVERNVLFKSLANAGTRFIAKSGTELKTFLSNVTDLPVGVPYNGKTYRYIGSQYADETVTIIHNGITDAGNRFRKGLYLSETKTGNIIEVGAYGGTNGKNLFEITNFQVNNLLDITDPNTIEILGTTFEQMKRIHIDDAVQYEFTQEIAIWAKNNGYSGVKFYGAHGNADYVNLLIFEQSTVNSAIKGSVNPEPW